ncbi:transcriptional regulator of sorbose uptake and utilization genes [Klebsiella pneumoniae]|uniref:Transcriptional regulator of sorbose uptake and utilization genes n=1 Tax=Klebsiella pneumoniae TaxID=573 RepID=A0A4P0XYB1_KLEPN|nr:transcriptional regulator of sorbose uptake and utilization genes [Klebsiella pneumoniae]
MAKQDEQRLLVKIATLYYLEGRKQSDIAQLLSLSQSFVSRAITRCQKEGVVKISVVQPSNIFLKLEKGLEDRYGLKQAVVVDTEEEASDHTIKRGDWLRRRPLSGNPAAAKRSDWRLLVELNHSRDGR